MFTYLSRITCINRHYLNEYLTDCTPMSDNGGLFVFATHIIHNAAGKAQGYCLVKPPLSAQHLIEIISAIVVGVIKRMDWRSFAY